MDRAWEEKHLHQREAAFHNRHNIPNGRTGGGRDQGHPPGDAWQRLLVVGIEQPFGLEFRLELLKRELKKPLPRRLDHRRDELITAARLIDGQASEGDDMISIGRRNHGGQPLRPRPETHGGDLGMFVLEGEIRMA